MPRRLGATAALLQELYVIDSLPLFLQVADLETLLGRLRASQFHLQGSTQRGLGAHSPTLAGFEGDAKAHARCYSLVHTIDCLEGSPFLCAGLCLTAML